MLRPLEPEEKSETCNSLCGQLGVVQSIGCVGSALDNAAAESFNSLVKVEYIRRHCFTTRSEARVRIATWITDFYNTRRRHSAAGGLPPVEFEKHHQHSTHQSGTPGHISKGFTFSGD